MHILLINPYWQYPYSKGEYAYNRIWPPLCLLNCAALLEKEGHRVTILDAHARRIAPNKINSFLGKGYNKIFITSSSLDKWQCPNIDTSFFLETVHYVRQSNDEVYIMGYHGTIEPERIMDLTKVKAIIRGEPEYPVLEICRGGDLSKIKSITFKEGGKIINTPQGGLLDLRKLPVPAYHLLDFSRYFYEILGGNFSLFETARGCKFTCRFCNKVMYAEGLRVKSKEQVLQEVTTAIEEHNVRTGYFIDLDFLANRPIVEGLCEYLIKKQYRFRWTCQTRLDLLDAEILEKMKAAGCKIIHAGIETGLQESLDYLNKNITLDKIDKAIKLCRRFGIKILAFVLFGLPNETNSDRERILKFVKKVNPDFVSFHRIVPYKGTWFYQNNFTVDSNTIDKFIRRAFVKYYLNPFYIFRLNPRMILWGIRLFYGRIRTLRQ
ncbi:MAG: radical SAM protein [Candidatus Omnitrophota bacterium]